MAWKWDRNAASASPNRAGYHLSTIHDSPPLPLLVRAAGAHVSRRRALGGASFLASVAALSAACGRASTANKTTPAPSAKQTGQPKTGGQFTAGVILDPFDFDPTGKPLQNGFMDELAYNGLLSPKLGADVKPIDLILQPGLAQKWESPDGQTYTFHLQPGVKFHDLPPVNGRLVAADDVKWSMEYQSRTGRFSKQSSPKLPPSLNDSYYFGLDRIDTPDPATVVMHFSKPFVPFLNYMAEERNGILAHEVFEQDGNFTNRLVGTGPWQLDAAASQHGSHWVMKKNPNYFRKGQPYIDQVNYLILPDEATNVAAFRSKQTDLLDSRYITPETFDQIKKENPDAVPYEYIGNDGKLLFENVTKPPLNDIRIRQAIDLCIDRDAFIKTFSAGKGQWALAGATPDLFTQDEVKKMLKHDPEQAKQLVSQAGYPNGVDLQFHYPGTSRGQTYVNQVQLIQAQLKQGNINVTLKSEDEAAFSANQRSGDFELDFEQKGVVGDIDAYVTYNWSGTSFGNFGKVNDPQLEALLDAQRQEIDPAKRKQILRQIATMIHDKAYYVAFFYGINDYFWQPYLKNYAPNVIHTGPTIQESWIAK